MDGNAADGLNPDQSVWVPLEAAVREAEQDVSEARQRVWAADSACYYAHRRYVQSRAEAERVIWLVRNQESDAAVARLQRAERSLAEARERADTGGR